MTNTVLTLGTLRVTVDATKQTSLRMLQQQYGDGYMARRTDGINPVHEIWNISTPTITAANATTLEQELISIGSSSFLWTPPNETTAKRWVLDPPSWEWKYAANDLVSLQFTLRRFYS